MLVFSVLDTIFGLQYSLHSCLLFYRCRFVKFLISLIGNGSIVRHAIIMVPSRIITYGFNLPNQYKIDGPFENQNLNWFQDGVFIWSGLFSVHSDNQVMSFPTDMTVIATSQWSVTVHLKHILVLIYFEAVGYQPEIVLHYHWNSNGVEKFQFCNVKSVYAISVS